MVGVSNFFAFQADSLPGFAGSRDAVRVGRRDGFLEAHSSLNLDRFDSYYINVTMPLKFRSNCVKGG